MKTLLEQRNEVKRKKPRFICQDAHKKSRLSQRWRRPKGIQSKMRLNIRGYRRSPSHGWGSPKQVRGLTRYGMVPVIVHTMADIERIDPKNEVAVLAGGLGKRKKIELIKLLTEKKVTIDNIKDPSSFIEGVNEELKERQKEKKQRVQKKEERAKEQKEKEEKEREEQAKEAEGKEETLADKVSEEDSSASKQEGEDVSAPAQESASEEKASSVSEEKVQSDVPSTDKEEGDSAESEKSGKSESQ